MKCPFCGNLESSVLESRTTEDNLAVRRRRECLKCKKRFTTYERAEGTSLVVIKKDGRREPFDREKLKKGILRATEKRPVSIELIDNLVDEVEQELRQRDTAEIPSRTIGSLVTRRLKKIDKVAYIRFASVYKEFQEPEDFEKEVGKIT